MLKFIGHAGFMYSTNNEILLMDPWMSKNGAFDSSWYQFPSNHSLGDEIRQEVESTTKEVYIYISHEHKDHFDVDYLKTLNSTYYQVFLNQRESNFRHLDKRLKY